MGSSAICAGTDRSQTIGASAVSGPGYLPTTSIDLAAWRQTNRLRDWLPGAITRISSATSERSLWRVVIRISTLPITRVSAALLTCTGVTRSPPACTRTDSTRRHTANCSSYSAGWEKTPAWVRATEARLTTQTPARYFLGAL